MTDREIVDTAAMIIADLLSVMNEGPPQCRDHPDPQAAAFDWLRAWREISSAPANPFIGRWLLEGPPPWRGDSHLPYFDFKNI